MSFLKPRVSSSSKFASLSNVMRDICSALFHLKLYMLSTKGTHQVQIFRLSTAWMKINQIPCRFSNGESFLAYISHHLSLSWHIIPLKFSSWNISLWTKRAHQNRNFEIFECFNENSPNSSCQFWNHKVKVDSNFASLFSAMKDKSPVFFYLKPLYFGQKEPVEVKCSNFWVVGWKINKFLMSCVKIQVSFCLNFASLLSVKRDKSSVLFKLNLYMIWTKGTHKSAKIQTFDCSHKILPTLYFDSRFLLLNV